MRFALRRLMLVLATAVLLLAVGTTAFSSTAADRGVNVDVVKDSDAYLGITAGDLDVESGDETPLLTLENQFTTNLDSVSVETVDDGALDLSVKYAPDELGIGNSGQVTAEVECSSKTTEEVELLIEASGDTVSVEKRKQLEVECTPERTLFDAIFNGCGNVDITENYVGEIDVELIIHNPGKGAPDFRNTTVDVNSTGKFSTRGGKLVGIEIPSYGVELDNPNTCSGVDL
ncbi:MAG: hypothetical protein SXQ77_09815 [Halobacteria archaeon]|nr:hypothetical protein [Halobacteria archaeon]